MTALGLLSPALGSTAALLADLVRLGIRLEADGDRLRFHPRSAVTPDLAERMKAHKGELLALPRPEASSPDEDLPRPAPPAPPVATRDAPAKPTKPRCRCGATTWRDVPIHGGQSTRRDCARCRRFIGFPVWYGH